MANMSQAEIVISALKHNLAVVKQCLAAAGSTAGIIAVVKADAYGHGAATVAKTLVAEGVKDLAVACLEEAVELHDAGLKARTIVFGPMGRLGEEEMAEMAARSFVPLLSCRDDLELLEALTRTGRVLKAPSSLAAVIKIDTGMGRIGFPPERVAEVSARLKKLPGVKLLGAFSHLAVADSPGADDVAFTRRQIEDFKLLIAGLERDWPGLEFKSMANSAAVLRYPESYLSAVRPGLMLYGVSPEPGRGQGRLEPVMRWTVRVAQLRDLPAGASVSYGRRTVLSRPSRIAVLPVGYADGLDRRLSPGFNFFLRGRPAPVAGVITMDLTMLDVSDVPEAKVGDRVLLLGRDAQPAPVEVSAADHARAAGTIPYTVLTAVGKRVPRIYCEE